MGRVNSYHRLIDRPTGFAVRDLSDYIGEIRSVSGMDVLLASYHRTTPNLGLTSCGASSVEEI